MSKNSVFGGSRLNLFDFIFPGLTPVQDILTGLAAIGIASFVGWYRNARPKVIDRSSPPEYIDYSTDCMIEEIQYQFTWGHRIHGKNRHVKLPQIPRDARFSIYYRPLESFRKPLSKDCYDEERKKKHCVIKLTDKSFFDAAETNIVYVEISITQSQDYREQIGYKQKGNYLVIENNNPVEIRNYPVQLPGSFRFEDLLALKSFGLEFQVQSSQGENPVNTIKLVLGKIPALQANMPGTVTIPLPSSASPPAPYS